MGYRCSPASCSVLLAGWYAVRRRGWARRIGFAVALALLASAVALIVIEGSVIANVVVVVAAFGAVGAAEEAFRAHVHLPRVEAPERAVLFYNPKSGGGKAERFHLAEEARSRGIEPVELQRGDDLEQLVRDAVARGADGLAMAGGDGSQAVVAKIASELDLPYACIPAGTRNHFALDLGVDRDDVVGALDAFVDGGERRVDLAEVNGQVFVNNVSLGLYAEAVQKPGYREAKLDTLLATVPDTVGPDGRSSQARLERAERPRVRRRDPRLQQPLPAADARWPRARALASIAAKLGIAVVGPAHDDGSTRAGVQQWTDRRFRIEAAERVPAGIDGEAVVLDPPLRFRSRPGVLRVRIAPGHPGASPSALIPDSPLESFAELARFGFGGAERTEGD